MTTKSQILEMLDIVPENELPILLEVVKRFIPYGADDYATADDIEAHRLALQDYKAGQALPHDSIDWN